MKYSENMACDGLAVGSNRQKFKESVIGAYGNRAPPRLLVIDCIRNERGVFKHSVYQGRLRITFFGISDICSDLYWLGMMRTDTDQFLKQFCTED